MAIGPPFSADSSRTRPRKWASAAAVGPTLTPMFPTERAETLRIQKLPERKSDQIAGQETRQHQNELPVALGKRRDVGRRGWSVSSAPISCNSWP